MNMKLSIVFVGADWKTNIWSTLRVTTKAFSQWSFFSEVTWSGVTLSRLNFHLLIYYRQRKQNERHWSAKPTAQQWMWLYLCVDWMLWLSHTCHVHCFVPACAKFTHEFQTLFERLVQLIFGFPSWFHTIWFYCSHAFHSFLSQFKLHSAFCLDQKTWSQRSHVFCLTGTAVLHCGHTFVGGILTVLLSMTNNQTCKERLS